MKVARAFCLVNSLVGALGGGSGRRAGRRHTEEKPNGAREVLRLVLIFESVDVILRRELIRRLAEIAKQVADGVVVLAMREPP